MLGAGRVIAIDEVPERLAMAEAGGAETIDFSKTDVYDELMKRTNKRGPDSCIDAVGCEASGHGAADAVLDKVKAAAFLATDRVHVLRQAIMCCRKAGTVSIPGVYVGMGDKIPLGAAMNKGLTIKTGQTHVQAYTKPLLKMIEEGEIDPSFVVTHPASLEDAPAMYKKFRDKEDGVIKVVLAARPVRFALIVEALIASAEKLCFSFSLTGLAALGRCFCRPASPSRCFSCSECFGFEAGRLHASG